MTDQPQTYPEVMAWLKIHITRLDFNEGYTMPKAGLRILINGYDGMRAEIKRLEAALAAAGVADDGGGGSLVEMTSAPSPATGNSQANVPVMNTQQVRPGMGEGEARRTIGRPPGPRRQTTDATEEEAAE